MTASNAWRNLPAVLLLSVYALAGWAAFHAHTDPTEMDTAAYLDAALHIRETGGVLSHIPNMLRGVYTEATQHPLYLLILSPFAKNSFGFFVTAKFISFLIGACFLALYYSIIRKWFGDRTAAGAGWLWAVSAGFLTLVTTVACEGLLAVWMIAFWFCLAAGREDRRWWYAAGVCAGLGFVTKSIGILNLPVFVLSAVWWERASLKRLVTSAEFWGFFGLFTLAALPLFVRNMTVYGTPLYSDSSSVMWIDHWREFSYERAAEGRFTMANYLSAHSPGQILQVMWDGLARRVPMMVADGLKPLPFWRPIDPEHLRGFYHATVGWQGLWAVAVTGLAGFGWWKHRRHAAAVPALAMWVIFAVFVGWYSKVFPATPPTRLMYPVLILLPVYAALGLGAVLSRIPALTERTARLGIAALLGVTLAGLAVHSGPWIAKNPAKSFEVSALLRIQMALAQSIAKPGEKVMVSTYFGNHLFYLKGQSQTEFVGWPKLDSMEDLERHIRENQVRYVFIDLATALYNPQVLGRYYRAERPGTLRALQPMPPMFKRIPRDPRIPPTFELYAIQTAQSSS